MGEYLHGTAGYWGILLTVRKWASLCWANYSPLTGQAVKLRHLTLGADVVSESFMWFHYCSTFEGVRYTLSLTLDITLSLSNSTPHSRPPWISSPLSVGMPPRHSRLLSASVSSVVAR
jgi:hypothetical protein